MANIEDFDLNITLFKLINSTKSKYLDVLFSHLYILGKGYTVIPVIILLLLLTRKTKLIKEFVIGLVILGIIVVTIKKVVNAPRPLAFIENVHTLSEHYKLGSFPSGDTALASYVSAILYRTYRSKYIKILLVIYTALIAYGRIYMGVHFPLDVVTGIIIGIMVARILKLWKK